MAEREDNPMTVNLNKLSPQAKTDLKKLNKSLKTLDNSQNAGNATNYLNATATFLADKGNISIDSNKGAQKGLEPISTMSQVISGPPVLTEGLWDYSTFTGSNGQYVLSVDNPSSGTTSVNITAGNSPNNVFQITSISGPGNTYVPSDFPLNFDVNGQ